MPIRYPEILELRTGPTPLSWGARDTILYALGIGMAADPLDPNELPFVYEKALKTVPSFATVAAWDALIPSARFGIDVTKLVHGDQKVIFHRPFPVEAVAVGTSRVSQIWDKGDKGAVIVCETELRDAAAGAEPAPLATLVSGRFARADGNFGGPSGPKPGAPDFDGPHEHPARPADIAIDFATRPDQALLYRLSGDWNPLHIDPETAARAGFARPILHGLCTFGITCRAVLQAFLAYAPERIASHELRFSQPVYPGETITVALWRDGDVVSFEARVAARNATVIKNGKTVLR